MVKEMVECGLISAQIGLESGNNEILRKYNKQITTDMIMSTIKVCRDAGLKQLDGNILLGGAGETPAQLVEQFDFVEKLLQQGMGMFEVKLAMFWPYPNTPITKDPDKYGVKILSQQCDYTINSIHNIVTESNETSRQYYVEHYYKLSEKIQYLYKYLAPQVSAAKILQNWGKEIFVSKSQWARAITGYSYINRYLLAKFDNDIKLSPDVFPIRTFDLLSYKNNCLYLEESNTCFNSIQSRILELCNGKNSVRKIAEELNITVEFLLSQLGYLEDKMLIFGSII